MKILVINGPNLNMLGIREPDIYGNDTYEGLCKMILAHAKEIGAEVEIFQSNHEGAIIDKLHALGPSHIIITGIRQGNMLVNYLSEAPGNIDTVALPVAGNSRPGTGDIFGSVLISCILKGQPLKQCVLKAARFVSECIRLSDEYHLPVKEGTCFELLLPTLVSPQE